MGLETANNLPEMVISNPAGSDPVSEGDDHVRLVKRCLIGDGTPAQGSLTPNFTGQYTGTADALNAVNGGATPGTVVNTFITRTGDVVAELDDYQADLVSYDNATSGLTATEVQAAIDELAGQGTLVQRYRAEGWGGKASTPYAATSYYASVTVNDITPATGTVTNNATSSWSFTAIERCLVTINTNVGLATGLPKGITVDANWEVQISDSTVGQRRCYFPSSDSNQTQVTASFVLEVGEAVRVHASTSGVTNDNTEWFIEFSAQPIV
jgi:hypothetical protein